MPLNTQKIFLNTTKSCEPGRQIICKNPAPPKIPEMPQNSTIKSAARANITPGGLTGINGHLHATNPQTLLYRGQGKSTRNAVLTVLTAINGSKNREKTKMTTSPQKSQKSQTPKKGYLENSPKKEEKGGKRCQQKKESQKY